MMPIVCTRSALNRLRPDLVPALQAYIDILLNSENLDAMPQWVKGSQTIWTAYGDFLTKLFTTDDDVQTLMDEMQATAEAAIMEE